MSNLNNRVSKLEGFQPTEDDIEAQIRQVFNVELNLILDEETIVSLAAHVRKQGYTRLTWASVMDVRTYEDGEDVWGD